VTEPGAAALQTLPPPDEAREGGRPEVEGGRARAEVTATNVWVNVYGPARDGEGAPLAVGTEVLALDPDGVVCGAGRVVVEGRYGLLPCYGDDPSTPEDEGAEPGDAIRLVVDGKPLATGVWTVHGERQRVALGTGGPEPYPIYLPLVVRAGSNP
jgi:hypothetical protein